MTDMPVVRDDPPPGAPAGLPLPPPPSPDVARSVGAGELEPAWRVATILAWVLVVFAYSSVWKVSVELGIGTWWLGPRSSPQPIVVRLVPFAIAIGFGLLSSTRRRHVPIFNVVGALLLVMVAIPDFSRSSGIATIELIIAGAVMLITLASFAGVVKTADR